jgi:hypothetical protein
MSRVRWRPRRRNPSRRRAMPPRSARGLDLHHTTRAGLPSSAAMRRGDELALLACHPLQGHGSAHQTPPARTETAGERSAIASGKGCDSVRRGSLQQGKGETPPARMASEAPGGRPGISRAKECASACLCGPPQGQHQCTEAAAICNGARIQGNVDRRQRQRRARALAQEKVRAIVGGIQRSAEATTWRLRHLRAEIVANALRRSLSCHRESARSAVPQMQHGPRLLR